MGDVGPPVVVFCLSASHLNKRLTFLPLGLSTDKDCQDKTQKLSSILTEIHSYHVLS